ncbi:MAG: DUF5606 domain-containing protein [Bacteroidetes bacterium]|nr:DUF5606 domain-containing protein [Bacteroidota bacterium]
MELKDIVHISGKPGLYKIVAHGKANLVVESLDASKTRTSVSVSQRFSVLDDISMFTTDEDIKLREVLVKLNDTVVGGVTPPSPKSSEDDLKKFFELVLTNYDKERVHTSDIKRLVQWYSLLVDDLDFEAMRKAKDDEDTDETKIEHQETKSAVIKSQPRVKVDTKGKSSASKTAINRKTV